MTNKKVFRGGVIPYYYDDEGNIQMLFMKPSDTKYGGAEFQVAKGKIEEGETPEEGAFREAKEELGLFKPNCSNIERLGEFLGRTTIFITQVNDATGKLFGKPHHETAETKWLTPDEFAHEGRDLHKPIVRAAVRAIENNNKND